MRLLAGKSDSGTWVKDHKAELERKSLPLHLPRVCMPDRSRLEMSERNDWTLPPTNLKVERFWGSHSRAVQPCWWLKGVEGGMVIR